ncbi:MAG: hypothetical protein Q7T80_14400 [Methanoregula sp.]|nr:hypothetical protein [Methanoregula sp.]
MIPARVPIVTSTGMCQDTHTDSKAFMAAYPRVITDRWILFSRPLEPRGAAEQDRPYPYHETNCPDRSHRNKSEFLYLTRCEKPERFAKGRDKD